MCPRDEGFRGRANENGTYGSLVGLNSLLVDEHVSLVSLSVELWDQQQHVSLKSLLRVIESGGGTGKRGTHVLDPVVETLPLLRDEPEDVLVALVPVLVLYLVLDLVLELQVSRHRSLRRVGVLERSLALFLVLCVLLERLLETSGRRGGTGDVGSEGVAGSEDGEEGTDVGRVGEGGRVGKGLDRVGAGSHGLTNLDERVDHLRNAKSACERVSQSIRQEGRRALEERVRWKRNQGP